jgi:putative sigma-54 modulation protein
MEIQVHSIHFTADKKLINFLTEKTTKLELVYNNITSCEVYLRLDKSQDKENKIVEMKVLIPGHTLVAKKQCKSFEESTDLTIDALKKQLSKYK